MNRITVGIDKTKAAIDAQSFSAEKMADLSKKMDMELGEYCRFQTLKSAAALNGKLSQDEAITIYALLGTTPEYFNRQPLEVKVVLTQVFASLLKH
jgi:hypothetical protein